MGWTSSRWVVWVGLAACGSPRSDASETVPARGPSESLWFEDQDGDGFGDPERTQMAVVAEAGWVDTAGDCDDTDPRVFPNAFDVPGDGVDQDCDGVDASCGTRPVYPGDLEVLKSEDLLGFCSEFSGMEGLLTVRGVPWSSLEPLACLCQVGTGVIIRDNPALTDVSWLAEQEISGPDAVFAFMGQPRVAELVVPHLLGEEVSITVGGNRILERLEIPAFSSAGYIGISRNPLLAELPVLPWLTDVTRLDVVDMPVLEQIPLLWSVNDLEYLRLARLPGVVDLRDLAGVTSIGTLSIESTPVAELSAWGVEHVGLLLLAETEIEGLSGLAGVDVGGLDLRANGNLRSLRGVEHLTTLDGLRIVGGSHEVTDLGAFANLTTISGDLELTFLRLRSLEGLERLTEVGGDLTVDTNWDLTRLEGLEGLRVIGGDLEIEENDALVDITALHGLTQVGGRIDIAGNSSLDKQAIADLQAAIDAAP